MKTGARLCLVLLGCGGNTDHGADLGNSATDAGDANGGAPTCFVDQPCFPNETLSCVDWTHYVDVASFHCSHQCGGEPCSGGTCEPVSEPKPCPAGQQCVPMQGYDHPARCITPDPQCGDGYCQEGGQSSHSCGSHYRAIDSWECRVGGGPISTCCVPVSNCANNGYCSAVETCHAGFVATQTECDLVAGSGRCCTPEG